MRSVISWSSKPRGTPSGPEVSASGFVADLEEAFHLLRSANWVMEWFFTFVGLLLVFLRLQVKR